MIIHECQLCHSQDLVPAVDLGRHPLADTFLSEDQVKQPESVYPLCTLLCQNCGYMTLTDIVPAEERYQKVDYSYTSGNSPVAIKHFEEMATTLGARVNLTANDLVIDIGSSDGTLLNAFFEQTGCRILGVEPAPNIVTLANKNGIPTLPRFFDEGVVRAVRGTAKVITANNVFNHITDLSSFMRQILSALTEDGIFAFEAPALSEIVRLNAFDTIYLEHVSYFGIKPLKRFFSTLGAFIHHVEISGYMGGSMRVVVGKKPATDTSSVEALIRLEEEMRLYEKETYELFMKKILAFKQTLIHQLQEIVARGGVVIGIGAATKGNTLLNLCGIDGKLLRCVTDSSPLKVGKFTPGSHLPIIHDRDIPPEATHGLILPWNIGAFLKEKLKHLNLTFIIPEIK